jgi:hypothetical protein
MRQTLFVLMALPAIVLLATCGGQKPAAAAKADTTTACCDSAALAKCLSDSTGGGCATPAPAETTAGKAAPAQCAT